MTSKREISYDYAFSTLTQSLENHKLTTRVKEMMTDFEPGLRNSLANHFPQVTIHGCYFHFCKALWAKASILGLRKKNLLTDTKILIFLVKILAHISNNEDRKLFWLNTKEFYSEKSAFKQFLQYIERYWIQEPIVNPPKNLTDKIERTNNACESFHRYFKSFIGSNHPSLGVFINNLLEYESTLKSKLLYQMREASFSIQNKKYLKRIFCQLKRW